VSRFNISVLLATALLGVLLWVVLSIVRDLARAPEEPLPMPTGETEISFDPALPHLFNYQDMSTWLNSRGLPGMKYISFNRRWLQEHGFPVINLPLAPPIDKDPGYAPGLDLSELDDTTLVDYAGRRIEGAMHELGDRSIKTDPLAALEWYDQAIFSGSLYAMVRTADLLITLSDPAISKFNANAVWQEALDQIRNTTPAPRERALAWSLALVTISGYVFMSSEHADRIKNLTAQLDAAGIKRACDAAQEYVLEVIGARRALGGQLFSTGTPPFFLTVADPASVIPCDVPVTLVTLEQCEATNFVGPGQKLMTAWICPL
jgi:hypothetical protein